MIRRCFQLEFEQHLEIPLCLGVKFAIHIDFRAVHLTIFRKTDRIKAVGKSSHQCDSRNSMT